MLLQCSYSCKFPASSIFSGWPWRYPVGQEPLPLKVAPIQPSVTAAFHLQSRRDSDCQMWELTLVVDGGFKTGINYLPEPCMIFCIDIMASQQLIWPITNQWRKFGNNPDSQDHGANMGPTWVLSAPGGPHVSLMHLAIRELSVCPSDMCSMK